MSAHVRRATDDDLPAILGLAHRTLGWLGDDQDARFFTWKHRENPFGPSPMWVAEVDGRLAGFRTFLRWELVDAQGTVHHAVRAVDTATDPDFQGRGIFTALTLAALEELRAEGVAFVFNTPNDQSRPGYLKMGWREVGRLPVAIRPTGIGSLVTIARSRTPAALGAVAVHVGHAADEALADAAARTALDELLAGTPRPAGLSTRRSAVYLAWRYGLRALHYRVVTPPEGVGAGFAAFHLRRRGRCLEAVVGDVLTPDPATGRLLLGRIAREAGADYLIRLDPAPVTRDGFVRLPRLGPILTARAVTETPPPVLGDWRLSLGDIELF